MSNRIVAALAAVGIAFSAMIGVGTYKQDLSTNSLYVPLNEKVLVLAKKAYAKRKAMDPTTKPYVMIVDFSLPSNTYRAFIYDMNSNKVIFQGLVAHGKGSGEGRYATSFSNVNMSKKSSLGLYKVTYVYNGKHGKSVRVQGLDKGFNDAAASRSIVVHPAPYVSDSIAIRYSRIGNSWGCFALDPSKSGQVIDYIKDNGLIFAYYPDTKWLTTSEYLK